MTTAALAETADLSLLGDSLGADVDAALSEALADGALFAHGTDVVSIFRDALSSSIREIETHPRGRLFQEFLRKGPHDGPGVIPPDLVDQRLADADVAITIRFISGHMVNCFKGAITELLAVGACSRVLSRLRAAGDVPRDVRLYVGDVVMIPRGSGAGVLKGADLHLLLREGDGASITVAGVVEVKSGYVAAAALNRQLAQHAARTARGLRIGGRAYGADHVRVGYGSRRALHDITVEPSDWHLPRLLEFRETARGRFLVVNPPVPPRAHDDIRHDGGRWHVELRWSKEAIAAAAYDMTFWYMEKVGEVIYRSGVPPEWGEMTAAEAGRNAAKMMLYYAILRARTPREDDRAVALYNSYSFGYALGMNFRDAAGRRAMLWPEHLDEIAANGATRDGCRIR